MVQARKDGDEGGLTGSILSAVLGLLVTGAGISMVLAMAGVFDRAARVH
jgi:hypothetical protein